MQKLRAGLELVVVLIFPIVVLAVLLGVVLAVVLAASVHGALGRIVAQLLFIPVVVGVIAAVRQALRARMEPTAGPALTREADPELWAVVDDLAQQAATATPDRIVLVSDANAEVLQAAGRRELLIGLPVFAALTVGELRAVLAHEMGHFAGGEAAANVRTLRARTFVKTMRDNSSILIRWFFSLYYRVAVWCTAATSRDLERRADGYSARAAGPQAAADAARAMTATSLVWDVVVEERVSLFEDAGRRAPLYEAVRHTLDAKAEDVGRAVTELLAEERPRWDSTHPRTADRIAAFEAMPASDVPRDDRPALALIGGPGVRLHRLEGELLRAAWPLATWDEVVAASLPALGDRSDRLLLALHEDGALPEPTVSAVLLAVSDEPEALGLYLVDPGDEASAREAAHAALAVIAEGTLSRVPGSRLVLDAAQDITLVDADGSPYPVGELAEDPVRLGDLLLASGVPLDRPVSPSDLRRPAREPAVLAGIPTVTVKALGRAPFDLLICDDGLLLVPLTESRVSLALGGDTGQARHLRVHEEAERLADLRADPTATWIPQERIVTARLALTGGRLTLTLVDGAELRIHSRDPMSEIPVWAEHALPTLLGDRLIVGRATTAQPA